MNKIILLSLIFSSSVFAKQLNLNDFLGKVKSSDLDNCSISSLKLPMIDMMYDIKANSYLNSFGSMKLKDFDMGDCISQRNILNGIITAHYFQKNKSIIGHHLKSYIAYDFKNEKMLIVMQDDDKKTYILGDRENNSLKDSLKSSFQSEFSSNKVDLDSKFSFQDIGNESRIAKEEEDKLKVRQKYIEERSRIIEAATKSIKSSGVKDYIKSDTHYNLPFNDSNGSKLKTFVMVKLDPSLNIPISKSEISKNLNFAFEMIKMRLKNPYSFKPREVAVEQKGVILKYIVKYTAQNSYGADVVDIEGRTMYLWGDGKYHLEPSK